MHKPFSDSKIKSLNKQNSVGLPTKRVILLLQSVDDPINVGSIFRTADGSGVEKLILTGSTPTPPNSQIELTARGLDRSVTWEYYKSAEDAIAELKSDGWQIIGLDITPEATSYISFNYSSKVCIVIGNEAHGIFKKVLAQCDAHIFIPMIGKGLSLNVNVAAAIATYEVITQ